MYIQEKRQILRVFLSMSGKNIDTETYYGSLYQDAGLCKPLQPLAYAPYQTITSSLFPSLWERYLKGLTYNIGLYTAFEFNVWHI